MWCGESGDGRLFEDGCGETESGDGRLFEDGCGETESGDGRLFEDGCGVVRLRVVMADCLKTDVVW